MAWLVFIAGLIELSTALPYIRDIRRGKTRPAIVTWITWLVLAAIAAAASYAAGALASGIISSAIAVECLLIVLFSLNKGHFTYSRFDIGCQIGALVGLGLWWWTENPLLALVIFVVIDATGALPTFRHAWRKPKEETLSTFALSIISNGLLLSTIPEYSLTVALVPAYLLVINTVLAGTIFFHHPKGPAAPSR